MAGRAHSRRVRGPLPSSLTPGRSPVNRRRSDSCMPQGMCWAGAQALHCYPASAVVQGRDQPAQRRQRVGHRPAVAAAVHGMVERADLDQAVDDAAQGCNQGGWPTVQFEQSASTMASARRRSPYLLRNSGRCWRRFLLHPR